MEKKYCSIHHLYYTGYHCPICLQEKSEDMCKRYYNKPISAPKENAREVTDDDLAALVAKFNYKS